ncbi:dihydrolipoyllysine-residue succinyltransferase, partial [Stenotrophomonas maltophilia]
GRRRPCRRRRFTAITEGVNPADVDGTGRRGAVTKEDIVNFARNGGAGKAGGARPEERVPMTRIRKRIAERLMESKNSTAMLTTFNEVDLSKVSAARKELQDEFVKAHGIKLGFMSFFVKAAANALQRFPLVNASIDGDDIIYHGYSDISIAVSTEKGLVTPVLRNVERMSFADIEKTIADYAKKARDGKLSLEELQGGTFTVTNGGTFGSLLSTPIINPPQSAILGMHAIKERPIAQNGQVVIAPMMYLALSYDHRIIDGKDSVQFLVDIKNQLENPGRMLFGL